MDRKGLTSPRPRTGIHPNADRRLRTLENRARRDLAVPGYPIKQWIDTPAKIGGERIFDVVIQGGGMQGLAVAHALRTQLITNIVILDDNESGREGPWLNYARMHFLRTPKLFVGPDLGLPSLSFREWFVARYGSKAWRVIGDIPKLDWVEYLNWFKSFLNLPIRNNATVQKISLCAIEGQDVFKITYQNVTGIEEAYARKVVRAAGIRGAGGPRLPAHLIYNLPRSCYDHSADQIDFNKLSSKRVAIVGAGASAYDNAATALEHGAISVSMLMRREKPSLKFENLLSTFEWMKHFGDMSDADRCLLHRHMMKFSPPPPNYAVKRVSSFENFSLLAGYEIDKIVQSSDGSLGLAAANDVINVDHIIFATGFDVDLTKVPELSELIDDIALWRDRIELELGDVPVEQGRHPYLGPNFNFLEKVSGQAPHLKNIYEFGPAATLSLGLTCVGLNSLNFGVRRLVDGVTRDFFKGSTSQRLRGLLAISPTDEFESGRAAAIASLK